MKIEKLVAKDLYYTKNHDWIDFQGSVAYVGVGNFKISAFKEIQHIVFNDPIGLKQKGELIATLKYNDLEVEVTMPVTGKVVKVNTELINGDLNLLLIHAESTAWLALVAPLQPFEREGLMLPKQYQMNGKSKYAK